MKLPHSRIASIFWMAIFLALILTAPAGAEIQKINPSGVAAAASVYGSAQDPTPAMTPATATAESAAPDGNLTAPSAGTRQGDTTGDMIRQRVFRTAVAGAAAAAGSLLLVWAYATLRDPIRRHRASNRIRELRREERRDRSRMRTRR